MTVTPTEVLSLEQQVADTIGYPWASRDSTERIADAVIALVRESIARDIEAADMPWTWRTAFKAAARIARGSS